MQMCNHTSLDTGNTAEFDFVFLFSVAVYVYEIWVNWSVDTGEA